MVIGIDASRANHGQKTGVEWYAWHIIEECKNQISKIKTDTPVQFILYSDIPLSGELARLPEHWQAKVLVWPFKRFWTQIRLSWEMLVSPPDVLFVPAHVAPFIHPKKTAVTIHDVAAFKFPDSYDCFGRWYTLFSARFALRHLWRVIVPSQFTKQELIKFEILRPRRTKSEISVIHHGADPRYKKIDDEQAIETVLKKYNVRKPFFLSVGRLEDKKNTANLVRAFTQLRINGLRTTDYRLQLVLVGFPGHGYEKVKEAIVQSACKHDIRLPGYVEPEDLVYLMNAATAFVYPSLCEGFGLPLLDAFSCGTPVLAGSGSSLEEVGGGAALYVDPMNVDAIADTLERIVTDEALVKMLAQKGFERVKYFSWEKAARETLEVLLG